MTDAPKMVWIKLDISLTTPEGHYNPVSKRPPLEDTTGNLFASPSIKYIRFDEHERILEAYERDYQDLLQTFNALKSKHTVLLREKTDGN